MDNPRYKVVRTLRCQNANIPGTLGKLATAIGGANAEIGNIATVYLGHHYTVRDIDVLVDNEEHLTQLIKEVEGLRQEVVRLREGRPSN